MMKIEFALAQELDNATKKERDKDKKEKIKVQKIYSTSTSSEVISQITEDFLKLR
ncbi:hypothetical protein HSX44_01585 [Wolbachia endosymbiont of Onchocerca gibsoni]|uniref:hypothetical protein n=1 Tax=Wolbachia endosymbiont of Onchocerca gibsoni TaxID=118986 RepID=UPI0023D866AA|nr:hypothetical protein [Wolbachia endosymbiont of Onchocerca gibsoni]MDF0607590.1 hypothetical protein [Wolbachia endosymbiont of Onchocerca gibsoni]